MKYILNTLLILLSLTVFSNNDTTIVTENQSVNDSIIIYQFDIKSEINNAVARTTDKAVERAEKIGAKYIIVHMNTFGGEVASADKIRSKLLHTKIPTIIFIDNNAASAGALISIACDSIYMKSGSNIGAASVVNQKGEKMPEKYQSYMRSIMRSTAEAHGKDTIVDSEGKVTYVWRRNPDLAQAMVDETVNKNDSSKIVTFTTIEAIEKGFCEGQVENIKDIIINKLHVSKYKIIKHHVTNVDMVINFLINPAVSGILIMIIIGGIYYEIRTPGIGFPITASIIAAVLFFAPHYVEGLAANWEIAIFGIGILLLLAEIFVIPGFGIAGILGLFLIVTAFIFSLVDNYSFDTFGFDGDIFSQALLTIFVSLSASVGMLFYIGTRFIDTKIFSKFALTATQDVEEGFVAFKKEDIPNELATTITPLEPIGKILLNDKVCVARADYGYINKGVEVKIIGSSLGEYKVIIAEKE